MKKILLLLFFICSVYTLRAQQTEVLNSHQYVFVPPLYYGKDKSDIYGIRATVLEKLTACGVPVITDENKIPREAMKNPCSMLNCIVNNTSSSEGRDVSVIHILFFDCKNDTVLHFSANANVLSAFKDTRNSFMNATRTALESLNDYKYHFTDSTSSIPVAQHDTAEADSIQWNPGRKLTWDDFKGNAMDGDPSDALTNTSNQTQFQSFGVGKRFEIESEITCYFIKSRSWVKPARKVDYLLNHEQRHFDLAEVGAREFRKKIKQTHFTAENFRDVIKRITLEINEKYHSLQEQYDNETSHSRIEEKQLEWNNKIDGMLKESEEVRK